AGLATYAIAQRGVGSVPESRDVFPALPVQQHLLLGRQSGPVPDDGWREEEVLTLVPSLERRYKVAAGALSGGEQQMLALGRALMGNP
ncbi:ATP-binding cassette domain-containing protein, partial [Klebsiella pneumoniae]|uniref:ATP-binding cassette domain-containing protein n=1 Tax=Klebsiella pneumoniae TaxID=573 RepID=UPI00274A7E80|nr:ABC transporter ATP-binding protein [Klebsiella pneumoniae]